MSDAYVGGRKDYLVGGLDRQDLSDDPVLQLKRWLTEASQAKVIEPNAMCLSTVDAGGFPSSRMVLLRGVDESGLSFYTNYNSAKGQQISQNSHVAVCFWWGALERQVRVEGIASKLTTSESDLYFHSRPLESQAASASSPQSQIVESREELEDTMRELLALGKIDRPDHWGGYKITPTKFEFWQGGPARLHDRFQYVKTETAWRIDRLAP